MLMRNARNEEVFVDCWMMLAVQLAVKYRSQHCWVQSTFWRR